MKIKNKIYLAITLLMIVMIAAVLLANKNRMNEIIKESEKKTEAFPVKVEIARLNKFNRTVTSTGLLLPGKELLVFSSAGGKIAHKKMEAGAKVKKSELLVQVEDEKLYADYLSDEAASEKADLDLKRFQNLFEAKAVSKRQLEDVELKANNCQAKLISSQKKLHDTKINAPFSGYINRVFVEEGEQINNGAKICELIDNSKLKIKVKVAASEILYLNDVQSVQVIPEFYNGQSFEATIVSISEKADEAKKFIVEIEIENSNWEIKAGIFAKVIFSINETDNIVISRQALLGSVNDAKVFVVNDGIVTKKKIIAGSEVDGKVNIISGLSVGDMVVTSGQINIDDGASVKIINKIRRPDELN